MRIYCLVTSYTPLTAYLYRTGFARFTHHRYTTNVEDIQNNYVHLTNVAIQKTSENYDERLGGKWDLRGLKLFLMSKYGNEKVSESFASPSMTANTPSDYEMKIGLLDDTFTCLDLEKM